MDETPDWKIALGALGLVMLLVNSAAACLLFWIWLYQMVLK